MRTSVTTRHIDQATLGYVTPGFAAHAAGRPEITVRDWMRRGLVATLTHAGVLYVSWHDVGRESDTRSRRRLRRVTGSA